MPDGQVDILSGQVSSAVVLVGVAGIFERTGEEKMPFLVQVPFSSSHSSSAAQQWSLLAQHLALIERHKHNTHHGKVKGKRQRDQVYGLHLATRPFPAAVTLPMFLILILDN